MAQEVILLEPDPELRLVLRALLEGDGYRVTEADPSTLQDVLRGSKARTILAPPDAGLRFGSLIESLRQQRPDLDVLTPMGYGVSLLEGAAERDAVSEFSRDALLLLSVLAEEGTRRPAAAERIARLSELTAIKLGLGRLASESCSAAASLVALGPSLAAFRFSISSDAQAAPQAGLSRELSASVAALSSMRCPFDLRPIIEGVDEQFDGRGRPSGLAGNAIPIAARILAVTREYATRLAAGQDEATSSEAVRSKSGSAFDPRVVDAFFKALRDDGYLQRMEQGGTGARVLLADGDEASLAVSELRLAAAGYRVTVAQDGNKAFELATKSPPDVLIADTVLPRLDGISLLLKLRRHPAAKSVPVIFTSSRTDSGLLNKALKLGAKDVLAKPVNFEILIAKMRTLSTQTQASQQQASGGIVGDLSEMPLADFLQVLALGRKTVKVSISSTRGQGDIYFDGGSPSAAFCQGDRGVGAFTEILSWGDGTFTLTNAEGPPEVNLYHTLDALVLQTAWENKHAGAPAFPAGMPGLPAGGEGDFGATRAISSPFTQDPFDSMATQEYVGGQPPTFEEASPFGEETPYGDPGEEDPYGEPPPTPAAFPSSPYEPNQYGTPTIGHEDADADEDEGPELDFGQSADHLNPFNL